MHRLQLKDNTETLTTTAGDSGPEHEMDRGQDLDDTSDGTRRTDCVKKDGRDAAGRVTVLRYKEATSGSERTTPPQAMRMTNLRSCSHRRVETSRRRRIGCVLQHLCVKLIDVIMAIMMRIVIIALRICSSSSSSSVSLRSRHSNQAELQSLFITQEGINTDKDE